MRLTRSSPPTSSAPAALRLLGLVALGEHAHADVLPVAVRQHDRAADHLVGVAGVDAEADVRLDGRVELDPRGLLEQVHRLVGSIDLVAVDELGGVLVSLAVLASSSCSSVRPGAGLPL